MGRRFIDTEKTCDQMARFIRRYIRDHGFPPSYREIGDAVGLRSTQTVSRFLQLMERQGRIKRVPGSPRSVTLS